MGDKRDLAGKAMVITGASAGIGLATAAGLAGRGAYVIGVGRSRDRCEAAKDTILAQYPGARVDFCIADLSAQRQIRSLSEDIQEKLKKNGCTGLDVLINNAGAFSSYYVSTAEGFELQWAVNHLAPFLLTHALLPLLKAAPEGRIITVSSGSHYRCRIHWKDVQFRRRYRYLKAYKQSKLANVLFTCELNRRLADTNVRAYAADPGLVNTGIGEKGTTGPAWCGRDAGATVQVPRREPPPASIWPASPLSPPTSTGKTAPPRRRIPMR